MIIQMIIQYLLLIVNYFWDLFKLWINTLFVIPFKTTDMLWLLIPVWIAWFFTEFFQEKRGTSLGNAISNAVVILWGSIDCTRQTVNLMAKHALVGFWDIFIRFSIIALVFIYGSIIVILGWKGNKLIKRIGRIRVVTYVFAVFAPVFYDAAKLTWDHVIAAVLFFPLFYLVIEFIDAHTPNPKAIEEDLKEGKGSSPQTQPQPQARTSTQAQQSQRPQQFSTYNQRLLNKTANQYAQQYPPQRSPPRQHNPYNRYSR